MNPLFQLTLCFHNHEVFKDKFVSDYCCLVHCVNHPHPLCHIYKGFEIDSLLLLLHNTLVDRSTLLNGLFSWITVCFVQRWKVTVDFTLLVVVVNVILFSFFSFRYILTTFFHLSVVVVFFLMIFFSLNFFLSDVNDKYLTSHSVYQIHFHNKIILPLVFTSFLTYASLSLPPLSTYLIAKHRSKSKFTP